MSEGRGKRERVMRERWGAKKERIELTLENKVNFS